MKNGNTNNDLILAEAREHKNKSALGFGKDIEGYRQRLRKGDKPSAMKLEVYYLSSLFTKGLYKECQEKADELHAYFLKSKDKEYTASALYYIARSKVMQGRAGEAMPELMKSIEMLSQTEASDMQINAEHALSDVFFTMGFNDQTLAILYRHKRKAEEMGDKIGVVILGSKISNIFRDTGRLDESHELLLELQPMIVSDEIPMPFPISYWREYAEYYLKINKPRKALEVYEAHFRKDLHEYPQAEAYASYLHALCLQGLRKYNEAEVACGKYIASSENMNFRLLLMTGYRLLVSLLIAQKKYKAAAEALKRWKGYEPTKVGLKFELMYERSCAAFYEETNDMRNALHHYKAAMDLEHTIQKQDSEIKLKALYQLSLEEFNNRELNEIKNQLQMKRDELEVSAIYLKRHQTMLSELDGFMKELREDNKRKKNLFKEVHDKIKTLQLHDSDKQSIEDKINSEQQRYIIHIKTRYPDLSNTEARVCSLLRSGLSSKEMAAVLVIDVHTIEQHRYRIRKKLGIRKGDDLMMVLNQS